MRSWVELPMLIKDCLIPAVTACPRMPTKLTVLEEFSNQHKVIDQEPMTRALWL